ncbi:MAG: phosphate ABC transporter permease PstA [Methylacidiphilales bacterium]|nr:phosphate ABC transporter permease PstA [Candidatus Methylacidiphilales bacterium]
MFSVTFRRAFKDRMFAIISFSSVLVTLLFLGFFLYTVIYKGINVWFSHSLTLTITEWVVEKNIDETGNEINSLTPDSYATLEHSLQKTLPIYLLNKANLEQVELTNLISSGSSLILNSQFHKNNQITKSTFVQSVPLDNEVMLFINEENESSLTDLEKEIVRYWSAKGLIKKSFNKNFFTSYDSKSPELAGVYGALVGSVTMLLIAFMISFPIGLGASVYFQELAPKHKITDYLVININNLAAVPSVIYGILGLTLFITMFGLPRASALVGGMVLSLMVMPLIIVTGMSALANIPKSIDEAALGLGASRIQVILHHKIPLALPGLLTGSIIGVSRALGESSPLLLIGMLSFISNKTESITDPIASLPTIIYLWSQQPEQYFAEKAAAAIFVLLVVLVFLNLFAILLRNRFQKRF